MPFNPWIPENDGIDHVNVYSNGRTRLGRYLTNFAHTPVDTPDGRFESVEGYWYWLGVPEQAPNRNRLHRLWGLYAKREGQAMRREHGTAHVDDFEQRIRAAIADKMGKCPDDVLREHVGLPLAHYYVFKDSRVRDAGGKFQWILDAWSEALENERRARGIIQ